MKAVVLEQGGAQIQDTLLIHMPLAGGIPLHRGEVFPLRDGALGAPDAALGRGGPGVVARTLWDFFFDHGTCNREYVNFKYLFNL